VSVWGQQQARRLSRDDVQVRALEMTPRILLWAEVVRNRGSLDCKGDVGGSEIAFHGGGVQRQRGR